MRNGRKFETQAPKATVADCLDGSPPMDLGAEAALLGSVILNDQMLDELLLVIDTKDFHDEAHAAVWSAMVDMHGRNKRIDAVTLAGELKKSSELKIGSGIPSLIAQLAQSVPSWHHATWYATEVRKASVLRQLLTAAAETVRDCTTDGVQPDECLERHESRVMGIGERELKNKMIDSQTLMRNAMDLLEARGQDGGEAVVKTGYQDLDDLLGGGMRAGNLIIVAARPSVGKTALAMNIAEHSGIEEKQPTMLVSLEMSSAELGDRLLASRSRVSSHRIRTNTLSSDDRQRIVEAASECAGGSLYVIDDAMVSVRKISAHARRLKRKQGLRLLVIDYLQLIDPVDVRIARQEQVAGIARGLKILARDLKIPVVCLAQLNRQAEDRKDHRPRLSDLRESGAIEQDADTVLFVHREELFVTGEDRDRVEGLAEIIIGKQRNGPLGTVDLIWRREVMRFETKAPGRVGVFDSYNDRASGEEFV